MIYVGFLSLLSILSFFTTPVLMASDGRIHWGPRPFFLVEQLPEGSLKKSLLACQNQIPKRSDLVIAHRGAPLQFPEHTKESYQAAVRMGAGVVECDVTFTKDRQLVCRHAQCDLHQTTNILAIPELAKKCSKPFAPYDAKTEAAASARCCTSDISLKEFKTLCGKMDGFNPKAKTVAEFLQGTADFRTDLYSECGSLMTHRESIAMFKKLGVKMIPELKSPEVKMPFQGDYKQTDYASQLVADYEAMKVAPEDVWLQSFNLDDVLYWIKKHPKFASRAVYLDGRYEDKSFKIDQAKTWKPSMKELKQMGVRTLAPPVWMLMSLDAEKKLQPSNYAKAAKAVGLKLVPWTLERSDLRKNQGGWYYQSVSEAVNHVGFDLEVTDFLVQKLEVSGIFTDWPATQSYYASCYDPAS